MLRLATFGLILLTFFGSAGVLIYSHTCLHEQITINTLFTSSDHCETDHQEKEADNCCDEPPTAEKAKNDHCCSESVSAFYLSFRFFEEAPVFQFVVPETAFVVKHLPEFAVETRQEVLALASDPDPPSGREILTRICVWRL